MYKIWNQSCIFNDNIVKDNKLLTDFFNSAWLGVDFLAKKDNSFKLTKEISRRYAAKTITNVDYADEIKLRAKTPAQAETLLHSLERAAVGIGLHVNSHKMEYMCFNQIGDISTLKGSSLKLVDKFD